MRHVAQFDLARFDSSCDENTRGRVETSDAPRRRLVLVSQGVPLETNVASTARDLSDSETESVVSRANLDDSHDQRLRCVRQRVKRSDVVAVVEVFRALSGRVGPVRANQEVPRQILRQTWSALNVPLMWAASSGDEECPVLLWLAHAGEQVESLSACDATWNGREAVFAGWGVHSREDLSEWIHSKDSLSHHGEVISVGAHKRGF